MEQVFAPGIGLWLDARKMGLSPADFSDPALDEALDAMLALEGGAISNPDEGRQVGHYWLRNPGIAPDHARDAIQRSLTELGQLVERVRGGGFTDFLVIGIGGSALGPQLLADAFSSGPRGLRPHFLDNTDPAGMDRTLAGLDLQRTLVLVMSKSGGTKETRNGVVETVTAFDRVGLSFADQAVAITCAGSALERQAKAEAWFGVLPMWDWVGGRTSITSMVGLAPLALLDLDYRAFLDGAAACDEATRKRQENPALLLALAWHRAGRGIGARAMVVLPYRDQLLLFSRYLQQLVMESIGKRWDLAGKEVFQGLTVYGNKGSTDQHAFVQQLREGPDDFFVTFITSLAERATPEVEPGVSSGDYLLAFMLGTRRALTESGRRSLTLVVDALDPFHLGVLVALYERAVGFYASMLGINAYHQPGVEAGKRAAAEILAMHHAILAGEPVPDSDDATLWRKHLGATGRGGPKR